MKKSLIYSTILYISLSWSPKNKLLADEIKPVLLGHTYYGQFHISNNDQILDGGDFKVNFLGADVQSPLNSGIIEYGWETGALISWDSDVRAIGSSTGSGGNVIVSIDVNSFLLDYYAGGYLAFQPAKRFRLSVGGGPILIWSKWESIPDSTVSDESISNSGWGAGVYARVILDIFITEQIGLNVGVRINKTTLSFDDATGKIDIEGTQYSAGMAFYF